MTDIGKTRTFNASNVALYYEVEKIDEKLTCPKCKLRYDIPLMLPCGSIVCKACLNEMVADKVDLDQLLRHKLSQCTARAASLEANSCNDSGRSDTSSTPSPSLINEGQASFECTLCNESHEINSKGFPTIVYVLMDLLKTKPAQIFRGATHKKLNDMLKKLEKDVAEADDSLKSGLLRIQTHCDIVRNHIDLATETLIEELNSMRKGLFEDLKTYQIECFENLRRNDSYKKEFTDFLRQVVSHQKSAFAYLKQSSIDEKRIEELIEKTNRMRALLHFKNLEMENFIFNYKLPEFSSACLKIDKSILGSLDYCNKYIMVEVPHLDKCQIIDFNPLFDIIPANMTYKSIAIETFIRNKLISVIDFLSSSFMPIMVNGVQQQVNAQMQICKLRTMTIGQALRVETEIDLSGHKSLAFCVYKNRVILVTKEIITTMACVKIFDDSLKQVAEIGDLTYQPISVAAGETFIYVLNSRAPFLFVYDWRLKFVKSYGQSIDPEQPFYFSNPCKFQYFAGKFYVSSSNGRLSVLQEKDGSLLSSFKMPSDKFIVDGNGSIIAFCDKLNKCFLLDDNGHTMFEKEVLEFPNGLTFFIFDGKLYLYDKTKFLLYLY